MEDAAQVGLDGLLPLVERHLDDITLRRDSRDGCASCRGRAMFPGWLHELSIASLALGVACAVFTIIDLIMRPQKMGVMNVVWPLTMLFGSVWVLCFNLLFGRASKRGEEMRASGASRKRSAAFAAKVAKGALHCGAGCTLGDILAEGLAFNVPILVTALGWHTLFNREMFAVWVLDFVFAFVLGIVFQYFAIAPMRQSSFASNLMAALKADTLSLVSWQLGMYGSMAMIQLLWLGPTYGKAAEANEPEFWFAMQLAMLAGMGTAYPVNWWLIRTGVKEPM